MPKIEKGLVVVVLDDEISAAYGGLNQDTLGIVRSRYEDTDIMVESKSGTKKYDESRLIPLVKALPEEEHLPPEEILIKHLPEALIVLARFAHNIRRGLKGHTSITH